MKPYVLGLLVGLLFSVSVSGAQKTKAAPAAPSGEPLKVRGQARNLSMQLMLKDKDQPVKFIQVRKAYRDEILSTNY